MPYPLTNVNGKTIERQTMGFGKSKILAWLTGLANSVVTLTGTEILTNKTLTSPTLTNANLTAPSMTAPKINEDVALTAKASQLNSAGEKAADAARLYNLGAPAVADDDLIVVSADMKVGEYEIAAQPDVPRNITATATATGTADTLGTITVAGTNYVDEVISEEITLVAGSTVAGTKAFKTITGVTGAGWVVDEVEGTADKVKIGIGNEIGSPFISADGDGLVLGILGITIVDHVITVTDPPTIEGTTINMSGGTYDGLKPILLFRIN